MRGVLYHKRMYLRVCEMVSDMIERVIRWMGNRVVNGVIGW